MAERLKDIFFQPVFYDDLVRLLQEEYTPFDARTFLERVFDDQWEELALKERVRHTTLCLRGLLPEDYAEALGILRRVAPRMQVYGFENMLFPDYVEVYGLGDWEASLPALEQFTQQMSAEFAVRPFVQADPPRMMRQMLAWADHESEAVRRLASEGSRPRLPWGMALPVLQADPSPILPVLEKLKHDPSEAVRRSVANNLNDISKDHPQVVLQTLQAWGQEEGEEIQGIISHALRTLIKQGDPQALELLGYPAEPEIRFGAFELSPKRLPIGGRITFSFEILSTAGRTQMLMIDYVVYLMRLNGKQTQKVFKLSRRQIAAGESMRITKNHSFAPVTTRTYYPGAHAVEVQINGKRFGRLEFELLQE